MSDFLYWALPRAALLLVAGGVLGLLILAGHDIATNWGAAEWRFAAQSFASMLILWLLYGAVCWWMLEHERRQKVPEA